MSEVFFCLSSLILYLSEVSNEAAVSPRGKWLFEKPPFNFLFFPVLMCVGKGMGANAEVHFYEIVEYLYEQMTLERAEEVTKELNEMAFSLSRLYHRGRVERKLDRRKKSYRYILFKRTSRASVKIIY